MKKLKSPLSQPSTTFKVAQHEAGQRIDVAVTGRFPEHSRSFFKKRFSEGMISLNGNVITLPGTTVKQGYTVTVNFPPKATQEPKPLPPNLEVKVLFESPDFLVICKPACLIVHTSQTNTVDATLVDWLLDRFPDVKNVGHPSRPGIVHRLDKETSGIMIIPKTERAHLIFSDLFKNRAIKKTYHALVEKHPEKEGTMKQWIERHPVARHKMMAVALKKAGPNARFAETAYIVLTYFTESTLLECKPKTGRTHQIRVHCAAIGHPIVGDSLYGKPSKKIKRHALHAYSLEFVFDGKPYTFTCQPPQDFQKLLATLTPAETLR